MPKRSSKKRRRDPNALAAEIVTEAIAESRELELEEAEASRPDDKAKNPHAQALGRLGGKKGGKARAAKLTARRRREIARKAARARWDKGKKSAKP